MFVLNTNLYRYLGVISWATTDLQCWPLLIPHNFISWYVPPRIRKTSVSHTPVFRFGCAFKQITDNKHIVLRTQMMIKRFIRVREMFFILTLLMSFNLILNDTVVKVGKLCFFNGLLLYFIARGVRSIFSVR